MYKLQSKQTTIFDFGMPLGLELNESNRWVQKAQVIPWDILEKRYASLFEERKTGNVAKPFRLVLGAMIIKNERQISDEELVLQIQECHYLQYFCGLPKYVDEPPFHPTAMVYFRKRLPEDIVNEINEIVINEAMSKLEVPPDLPDNDTPLEPEGQLIVDSTCAPQNIRYPQDLSLLNEAREKLETMIDHLHQPSDGKKPRTYRQKARKLFLKLVKKKRKSKREIRVGIGQQLRFIRRNFKTIEHYFSQGRGLPLKYHQDLSVIYLLFEQQKHMYEKRVNRVQNRIVSIKQYWVRPIVRGKVKAKVEFGTKLDVSVFKGFTRLENTSFDAYNEGQNLIPIIERHFQREGRYPAQVLADQIYRTNENLKFCKKHGIEMLGPPLGRPPKNYSPDKKRLRQNEINRIEVERKIGYAKGSFGLNLIRTKLKSTSFTTIAMSILAMNVTIASRLLFCFLYYMRSIAKIMPELKYLIEKDIRNIEYRKMTIVA